LRKEINQFSLDPLGARTNLSRKLKDKGNSKALKNKSKNSKLKVKIAKGPNYIKLTPIYTLSILG